MRRCSLFSIKVDGDYTADVETKRAIYCVQRRSLFQH